MAAIRMLFSWLTEKGVLAMNPARGSQDREICADRLFEQIDAYRKRNEVLEKQVSELKKGNAELTASLKDAVLLVETIYGYLGVDRVTGRAEEVRRQIVKRFNDLRARLAISESPF
jgi:hypothetical protein